MTPAAPSSHAGCLQTIVDDGWQGEEQFHFSGRLTKVRRGPAKGASPLGSLYRNARLLATRGAHGVVTVRVAALAWTLRTDEQGYWELRGRPALGLPPGWHEITCEPGASSPAGLLVADSRNTVGIISDVDDTILVTGVLHRRSLLKNSLLVTPENRRAVPVMPALYHEVLRANPVPGAAPVFYLSSTPRQLTDNVRRFLAAGGFPRGVLQLKELSRDGVDRVRAHAAYKLRRIEAILTAFPRQSFHLFGDDAEGDPEIYARVRRRHAGRIAGIWINRLNPRADRPRHPGQRDVRELLG